MKSTIPPKVSQISQNTLDSAIYLSFGIIVVILNIIEIIIICRLKRKKKIYEILLLSLSISDLLFGLSNGIISILYLSNIKTNEALEISYTLYFYFIVTSVLHLIWISVDRLWAVYAPLKHNMLVTRKRTKYIIIITWVCTTILASSLFINDELTESPKSTKGLTIYQTSIQRVSSSIILITDMVMLTTYSYIVYLLRKQSKVTKLANSAARHKQVKAIALCILVAVMFVVFTLPYCINFLAAGEVPFWASLLLLSNSGMNCIVYCFRGTYENYLDKQRKQKQLQDKSYMTPLSSPMPTPATARKDEVNGLVLRTTPATERREENVLTLRTKPETARREENGLVLRTKNSFYL